MAKERINVNTSITVSYSNGEGAWGFCEGPSLASSFKNTLKFTVYYRWEYNYECFISLCLEIVLKLQALAIVTHV